MAKPFVTESGGAPSPERARTGREVAARLDAHPLVERVPAADAQVYLCANFLSRGACARMIALVEADLKPSTLLTSVEYEGFRTSHSCNLDRAAPEVRTVDEAIGGLLGLPYGHGETIQGQRYTEGQLFRAHCDYFWEDEPYWQTQVAVGGQRTWTAMVYLNAVEQGGGTWFPQLGLRVTPVPGLMLIWNNMALDGSPNFETLHEGEPVTRGTKYVITKWFRERPWGLAGTA